LNRWFYIFVLFSVTACSSLIEKRQKKSNEFYDINGLIDKQVKLLDSISPSLYKEAVINGQEDDTKVMIDDSTWIAELNIFRTLDLNNSKLTDNFQKRVDSTSTQKAVRWISKVPFETAVDTLVVIVKHDEHPHMISASLSSQNTLFKSKKNIQLHFTERNQLALLSSYSIEGWQKMMSQDTTYFQIQAYITF